MTFLSITNLDVVTATGKSILEGISFKVRRGEHVAIAGETGSGKSTLLKAIAGLQQPHAGRIDLEGEHVPGPAEKLVPGDPRIAYLTQEFDLPQFLRVEQVLDYANLLSDENARIVCVVCQIDHLLSRGTDQLSGGEKQRVAIARLLLSKPKLLLLDEPYSNLDLPHKITLMQVIEDVARQLKITCMMVSHDPDDLLSWSDRIIVLRDGKIVQDDLPAVVYEKPADRYVAGLLGDVALLDRKHSEILGLKGDNFLVRPEHFEIVRRNPNALKGEVQRVRFKGHHWEISVRVDGSSYVVRSLLMKKFSKGDTIHISLVTKKLHKVRT